MEGLDFGTMLDDEQMDLLFSEQESDTSSDDKEVEDVEDKDNNEDNTAEVDPENMFDGKPESVGSVDNKDGQEDTYSAEDSASPNFFSSIANAFAEEGIFPDLDDQVIKSIKTAKDLRSAIDEQIKAGLDEQQKRVADALNNNVELDKIRQYESLISYLDNIKEEDLNSEGEQGEELRKRLLYQDYVNRGFSK